MKFSNKKIFLFFLIIIIILSAFFIIMKKRPSKNAQTDYITTTLTKGSIVKEVSASGTVNPVNIVRVGTQLSGTIEKIYADYNDEVKKGQMLAELDKSILKLQIESAKALLKKAKAKKYLADVEAVRKRNLFKTAHIAKSDIDKAETDLKIAEAEYDAALSDYKKANINLGYATITSPVSGVVISREVDEGQTVSASLQSPDFFQIAEDISKMQVETSVSEADVGLIKKGQDAFFTVDAYEYETFKGQVKQIRLNPKIEQNVVTYTVIIEMDNLEAKLLPGMTAFVTILIDKKDNVLKIPNTVFNFKMPSKNQKIKLSHREAVLYLLDNEDKILPLKVIKGISNAVETEIISSDVKQGDKIIEDIINFEQFSKKNTNKPKVRIR
jgi:HlyD family secretion protein